ncbi:MAG: hypothetical protein GY866_41685 [Proteobacteria bacterium]|nr:hypothetical protein [Pseudomonadota bacterium]
MKLENFGHILGFAADMEAADRLFYETLADNPTCGDQRELYSEFAKDEKKNEKTVLRARRENVTEMILERIAGFDSDPFLIDRQGAEGMSPEEARNRALKIESTAEAFYSQAAEKLAGMPEISRILKKTAKKRKSHRTRLEES